MIFAYSNCLRIIVIPLIGKSLLGGYPVIASDGEFGLYEGLTLIWRSLPSFLMPAFAGEGDRTTCTIFSFSTST
jgi:hypothetical protein